MLIEKNADMISKIHFAYVDTSSLKVFKEGRIPDRTFRWREYANMETDRTFFFFFMVESGATPIKPLSKYLQN